MVKTLCIYILYLPDNKIKNYHKYMINQLNNAEIDVIVVVNGEIDSGSKDYLLRQVLNVYVRNNIGFDAGAYKEFFTGSNRVSIEKYDQCILMNDTFCGPFGAWNTVLDYINDVAPTADFWGFTKWIEGYSELLQKRLPEHIQSYFICVRKTLLSDASFNTFWEEMAIPTSYEDAIEEFEVKFTQFFNNRGFNYTTWIENKSDGINIQEGEVIYNNRTYELVKEYDFPLLKRRACTWLKYGEIRSIWSFFDSDETIREMIRDYYFKCIEYSQGYKMSDIDTFFEKHSNVYIYGNGQCSTGFRQYLADKEIEFTGVVTTNKESSGVFIFDEIEFRSDDGIIVAVNHNIAVEIVKTIRQKWPKIDVFILDKG